MLIKFSHPTGVSTIRVSDTEATTWRKIAEAEGDSLNETIGWLWSNRPAQGNFTQWVRDQFLIRISTGEWDLAHGDAKRQSNLPV